MLGRWVLDERVGVHLGASIDWLFEARFRPVLARPQAPFGPTLAVEWLEMRAGGGGEGAGIGRAERKVANPPNGHFWAQKLAKTVSPKNDPASFGKVYGVLFCLGFRPPLAPEQRLVQSQSAGQQARTHVGERCRLADKIII